MLNFSLYLTVGKMTEAFKAIKFIKRLNFSFDVDISFHHNSSLTSSDLVRFTDYCDEIIGQLEVQMDSDFTFNDRFINFKKILSL